MIRKIRSLLSFELIAYYFAAPYIMLMALDDTRGLLNHEVSDAMRLFWYASLFGFYPLMQSIVSPFIGKRLDRHASKVSVLRNIHLANTLCYALLALSAFKQNIYLSFVALAIPGFAGSCAPVGKSLIASLSETKKRAKEFAFLAFMKGAAKCFAPLLGVVFFSIFHEYSYMFCISALFSFTAFLTSFSLKKITFHQPEGILQTSCPRFTAIMKVLIENKLQVLLFITLLTGSGIFVKFTPFLLREKISQMPNLINYLSSIIGLSYAVNQLVVFKWSKGIVKLQPHLYIMVMFLATLFCFSPQNDLWFLLVFGILFCFSALTTCQEATLSLHGIHTTQGRLQGVLYSVENTSYIIAPYLGSALCYFSPSYPFYFVTILVLLSAFSFFSPPLFGKRSYQS